MPDTPDHKVAAQQCSRCKEPARIRCQVKSTGGRVMLDDLLCATHQAQESTLGRFGMAEVAWLPLPEVGAEVPAWITDGIALVQHPKQASVSRYPYTFAYDYLRSHAAEFGVPAEITGSRGDVSVWLRDRLDVAEGDPLLIATVNALADAYLAEHNLVMPQTEKPEA